MSAAPDQSTQFWCRSRHAFSPAEGKACAACVQLCSRARRRLPFPRLQLIAAMSPPSKLTRKLSNLKAELASGRTRGLNPRDLTAEEIERKTAEREELKHQMHEERLQRTSQAVNAHTTAEADRGMAHATAEQDRCISAIIAAKADILAALASHARQSVD